MSVKTSALSADSAFATWRTEEAEDQPYDLFTHQIVDRWVEERHHSKALEIDIRASKSDGKDSANDKVKWASDLRRLQLQQSHQDEITFISIHQERLGDDDDDDEDANDAPTIPVQLLTTLCRGAPNLEHLECDIRSISGTEEEFQEWANILSSNNFLTHVSISFKESGSSVKEACQNWEPVITSILSSSANLQELIVKYNYDDNQTTSEGALGPETSSLILELMEQQPTKRIVLSFPLRLETLEDAARYYNISEQPKAVVRCSSPLCHESTFMGRFFHTHKLPILPDCSIHVSPRQPPQTNDDAQQILVQVCKRKLADPHQLQAELQQLLPNARVTPPVITNLQLFLNPNYLKSRFIYSLFPPELWHLNPTELASNSWEYQQMVAVLQEGRILGQLSLDALYQWFSARPNHLVQLNYYKCE